MTFAVGYCEAWTILIELWIFLLVFVGLWATPTARNPDARQTANVQGAGVSTFPADCCNGLVQEVCGWPWHDPWTWLECKNWKPEPQLQWLNQGDARWIWFEIVHGKCKICRNTWTCISLKKSNQSQRIVVNFGFTLTVPLMCVITVYSLFSWLLRKKNRSTRQCRGKTKINYLNPDANLTSINEFLPF